LNLRERAERIVELLDEKKAEEIELFDLEETDYIVKTVVIANSLGGKHTQALYDHLKDRLKPLGEEFVSADESDEWIVVDMGDILVHIMTPNYRRRYDIEQFLSELKRGVAGEEESD
jgi:ribosome silencing factor RsfS/YbeB/iojap